MASSPINIPIKSCSGTLSTSAGVSVKIGDYPSGYSKNNTRYLSNIITWTDGSMHCSRPDIVVALLDTGIYAIATSGDPTGKPITIYFA